MTPFQSIPLVDNHLHPPLPAAEAAARLYGAFFTEADDETLITRHAPYTRFYGRAMYALAELLGCDANEDEICAARAALGVEALLRRCVEAGNVAALVVDDGYPTGAGVMTPAEMGRTASCSVKRVLRLESLLGELVVEHDTPALLAEALLNSLDEARRTGTAALKSIIAYRCGLDFYRPSEASAAAALKAAHERAVAGNKRLTDPELLFYTLAVALEWAGDAGLPVQLHSGFGDRDLHLVKANPALLRSLLEDPALNRSPLILLHAAYPYCREVGYMAAVYPNLYVDWSEANPLLAGPGLVRALQELLDLAPATKLLYGSDAWGIPDWIYLGARFGRESLAAALEGERDAEFFARRILHDNAAELYSIGG